MSVEEKVYRKFIWKKIKNKYEGKIHTGAREKTRRVKQIEKGQLTKSNGLKG